MYCFRALFSYRAGYLASDGLFQKKSKQGVDNMEFSGVSKK